MTNTDLIARLEAAGPKDEATLLGTCANYATAYGWITSDQCGQMWRCIDVDAYESAALILMPEGWDWLVRNDTKGAFTSLTRGGQPTMVEGRQINPEWHAIQVYAATPALSLSAAALRAR